MENSEIALRLAEAILSSGSINLWLNEENADHADVANELNAQQVADFYLAIINHLNENQN